jgi:capsid assembly protease
MTRLTSPLAWEAAGDVRPLAVNPGDVLAIDPQAIGGLFSMFSPEPPDFDMVGDSAVLSIRGPLSQHDDGWFESYEKTRRRFDKCLAAEGAKRVVLKLSSPGGYVSGCFELAAHIRSAAEAAGKEVVAYVDGQTTSAAYALACAADTIVTPPTGVLGSIGVVLVVTDISAMAERAGVRFHVLTSGARKADGSQMLPLSEASKIALQENVDAMAAVFFKHVAEARGMSVEAVSGLEAGVFVGEKAVEAGLADSVATFDDLVSSWAKAQLGEVKDMKEIAKALGCADASGAEVLASAAAKIVGERDELLAMVGAKNTNEARGVVEALKADKAALESANAKLAEINAAAMAKERADLLDQAAKLYCPAKMETIRGESVEFIRKFMSLATPDMTAELHTEAKAGRALTPSQKKAAASAGMTEAEFSAELDRLAGIEGGAQ